MSELNAGFYNSDSNSDSIKSYHEDVNAFDKFHYKRRKVNKRQSEVQLHHSLETSLDLIKSTWLKLTNEYTDIGYSADQKTAKQKQLVEGIQTQLSGILHQAQAEKHQLKQQCSCLQKNIFKMLRVFSKNGFTPRRSPGEDSVTEDTYTEINQIFTNEEEFNNIMSTIPDEYVQNYILCTVSNPYNETLARLTEIAKLLSKEYFVRILKFLKTVLLLKELAEEIDFYLDEDSAAFCNSLPTIDQCKICIQELEKVSLDNSNVDTVYKVVLNLLKANNFNNLSKTYHRKIQIQIGLIDTEKSKKLDLVIDQANMIVNLWTFLYDYSEGDDVKDYPAIDERIIKCAEGEAAYLGLTQKSTEYLQKSLDDLNKLKHDRETIWNKLLDECDELFARLKKPEYEIETFYRKYSEHSLSQEKINDLKSDIQVLRDEKKHYMKDIVNFVKLDLEKLWQKLYYSDKYKYECTAYWSEIYDDSTLDSLEKTLVDLQTLADKYSPMFDLVAQFNQLLCDKQELDDASKNPSRLLAKNSGMQLLKEEKLRRNIKRRFPKVCAALAEQLAKYDKATSTVEKSQVYHEIFQCVSDEKKLLDNRRISSLKASPDKNNISPLKHTSPIRRISPLKASQKISPLKSTNTKISPIRKPLQRVSPAKASKFGLRKVQSAIKKSTKITGNIPATSFSASRNKIYKDYFKNNDISPTERKQSKQNFQGLPVPKLNFNEVSKLTYTVKSPKPRTSSSNKENNSYAENHLLLLELEKLRPISYKELENIKSKKKSSKPLKALRESNIFNDSMGEDSMYNNWRDERLRELRDS